MDSCRSIRKFAITSLAVVACLAGASVRAQYDYDPTARHEMDNPGPRLFGSVKDERGVLVEGATIVLDSDRFSFVLVTNALGRFQISAPLGTPPEKVTAKCSKPGYQAVRINRRPGPNGVKPMLQIDCVLRAVARK